MSLPDLVAELQLYAKARTLHARAKLDLTALTRLCSRAGRTIADCVDEAVLDLASESKNGPVAVIFPPGDSPWETNLSGRQKLAAAQLGISYDTFRRRRDGMPSPYDEICELVAHRLLTQHDRRALELPDEPDLRAGVQSPVGGLPGSEARNGHVQLARRWRAVAIAAIGLLTASLVVLVTVLTGRELDDVSLSEDAAPVCTRAIPDAESPTERARYAIQVELARTGSQACVLAGNLRQVEEHYFYDFNEREGQYGGAVVRENADGDYVASLLPPGPWQSYSRLGVNDGGDVIDLAGFATGEIVPSHGGYSILTDGGGYFHGESRFSVFYWMPSVAYDRWIEEGAENGRLGAPASYVYIFEGALRVDFETGSLVLQTDGSIATVVSAYADLLPEADDLPGTMIASRQGTAWFVDDQLRRWWIPNQRVERCAGGDPNTSAANLPGGAIHALEFAGVASCPLDATGIYPREGSPEFDSYCWDLSGSERAVQLNGGDWACDSEDGPAIIDSEDACKWQYGPTASVHERNAGPYCIRSQSG